MNLESQVCSLELAKRLKELDVEQKSLFYWIEDLESHRQPCTIIHYGMVPDIEEEYSAFTVAELGEILPAHIRTKDNEPFNSFYLNCVKRTVKNIMFMINYECDTTSMGESFSKLLQTNIYDESEADARAKMLIYLLENKLIDITEKDQE